MAAPNASPDLSVVDSERTASAGTPSTGRRPAPGGPAPAKAGPAPRRERRGVPIWLLILVALVGVVLTLVQYQRAERLGDQVSSLQLELAEVGEQLAAHQRHLDLVRDGVTDLSERVGSLKALADRDPLAPAPEAPQSDASELPGVLPTTPEIAPGPIGDPRSAERDILGSALSTPLTGGEDLVEEPF